MGDDGQGGHVTTHSYCEAKGATRPAGLALIMPGLYTADPNAGRANLSASPFLSIGFPANCTSAIYGGKGSILEVEAEPQQFKQRFFLLTEATRHMTRRESRQSARPATDVEDTEAVERHHRRDRLELHALPIAPLCPASLEAGSDRAAAVRAAYRCDVSRAAVSFVPGATRGGTSARPSRAPGPQRRRRR